MQSLRRTAVTAARTGRTTLPRQQRRFAHDEHAHGHGHAVNEPIGVRPAPRIPPPPLPLRAFGLSERALENCADLIGD
jgi:hypothetical protein